MSAGIPEWPFHLRQTRDNGNVGEGFVLPLKQSFTLTSNEGKAMPTPNESVGSRVAGVFWSVCVCVCMFNVVRGLHMHGQIHTLVR